jgi:hypothetical protein
MKKITHKLKGTARKGTIPFTAGYYNTIKTMSQVVLVAMVANGTQIIIGALCTLPSYSKYRLLSAGVTHSSLMLDSC